MTDFFTWFVGKHYLVSALLFPEVTFAWAVWMRWYGFAAAIVVWISGKRFNGLVLAAVRLVTSPV